MAEGFYKMLTFLREKGKEEKIAVFTDKDNRTSRVVTTWKRTIPGLRYNCFIGKKYVEASGVREYTMLNCRVWVDKISVVAERGAVEVMLDGKPVENLTYDPSASPDYESKVEELRDYFKNKTFQLSTMEDVEAFVNQYVTECKAWYRILLKDAKTEHKKNRNTPIMN